MARSEPTGKDKKIAEKFDETATPTMFSVGPEENEPARLRQKLGEMEPVRVNTSAFGEERDAKRLRILAQQEFNKFVKQEPVKNEFDGRSIKFSFEQFGKPRSHSADPRIMRIVPGLREMLQKAVPIESRAEQNRQKYRNIRASSSHP